MYFSRVNNLMGVAQEQKISGRRFLVGWRLGVAGISIQCSVATAGVEMRSRLKCGLSCWACGLCGSLRRPPPQISGTGDRATGSVESGPRRRRFPPRLPLGLLRPRMRPRHNLHPLTLLLVFCGLSSPNKCLVTTAPQEHILIWVKVSSTDTHRWCAWEFRFPLKFPHVICQNMK